MHPRHGEPFHSRSGAWLEARERYAGPCRLAERAGVLGRPLRLCDLGTGPGWNLAAALAAVSEAGGRLEVDSFELEPGAVRAGLALPATPQDAEPWIEAVRAALRRALAEPAQPVAIEPDAGALTLWLGDARSELARAGGGAFDAVFLDGFSPGREGPGRGLWGPGLLAELAARMDAEAVLSTFTCSFDVRLALARAGLRVGRGPAVGAKRSGTLASPALPLPPLRSTVLARLSRELGPGGGEMRAGRA